MHVLTTNKSKWLPVTLEKRFNEEKRRNTKKWYDRFEWYFSKKVINLSLIAFKLSNYIFIIQAWVFFNPIILRRANSKVQQRMNESKDLFLGGLFEMNNSEALRYCKDALLALGLKIRVSAHPKIKVNWLSHKD